MMRVPLICDRYRSERKREVHRPSDKVDTGYKAVCEVKCDEAQIWIEFDVSMSDSF